ncbi:MAG: GatB/YqeY domain-containing protein [Patescibacteria group bacterium]
MSLQEKIKTDMVQAMRDRNALRVGVLRGLMASFVNELVAKKKKPEEPLADDEAVAVILRAIKQRKDSIDQFKKGGRNDLVASESAELAVLEEYSPKFMSRDEILKIAKKKKEEMGVADKSKMSQLMSVLMKELKGKADGAEVKAVVETLFI